MIVIAVAIIIVLLVLYFLFDDLIDIDGGSGGGAGISTSGEPEDLPVTPDEQTETVTDEEPGNDPGLWEQVPELLEETETNTEEEGNTSSTVASLATHAVTRFVGRPIARLV